METGETVDVKKYVSQLERSPKDPWDWRPSPECLSIRDVVNILRVGATDRNMYHLSRCERDRRWVDNYAQMAFPLPTEAVSTSLGLWKNIASLFGVARMEQPAATLLYVLDKNVKVQKAESPVTIEIAVVGGLSRKLRGSETGSVEIDPKSLRLEGALTACGATVERREIEPNLECLVIRFDDARLAGSPRKGIEEHGAVMDSVSLSGRLSVGAKTAFRGQADVQLIQVIQAAACH